MRIAIGLMALEAYITPMQPPPTGQSFVSRRDELTAQIRAETGIDEAMIAALVETFYAKVRADPLLGPVFAAKISDWAPHLEQMKLFWSSVALMTGVYHGRPMPKHIPLPIEAAHFDRWLELFEETAHEVCPLPAADHFIERARRIAESLELGVASANGVLLNRGERYRRAE
ncbi:group III truncated hemoglobin [Brevundimonas sp. 2R-24]|uniref:Group III truncated hemoglobin n=1 Tax=Peiella sedimenti TaxID=3061083 RepID=A0ABT8SMB5_9CAUL|nr:group III truncated hemoglobin [Caulobacteraceae bacterium XZ-24]